MFDLDLAEKPVNTADGQWVDNIPDYPGVRFKVRSSSYKPFEAAHNRLIRSFGKKARDAAETPEYQKAVGKLLSDHILVDWDNAVKKDGEPVSYDKELAEDLLTKLDARGIGKAFRNAVSYAASVVTDRHQGLADELAGE